MPRLARGTLPERLAAVREVRLAAFKAVRLPEPFNWTSWLAPLNVLPCLVMLEASIAELAIVPVRLVAGRFVKLAPDPEKVPAVSVPLTVPLETKKVAPDCRLLVSCIAFPRLATGTLPDRLFAVSEVKFAAFNAGRLPEPFN